jgi:hypothetical protein
LASFLTALFSIISILNLYVDTKVPVALYPYTDPIEYFNGAVTVTGTWTRTDLTDDTIGDPLQTSKIICVKEKNLCTEAKAYVIGGASQGLMEADLVEYNIESWTSASIVFGRDYAGPGSCETTVYTIDLNTQTVSGAGHLINQDKDYCKTAFTSKHEKWSFLLANGQKVYWEQRQKARPALLKIIQAFFGN